jgi:hypothetical protein
MLHASGLERRAVAELGPAGRRRRLSVRTAPALNLKVPAQLGPTKVGVLDHDFAVWLVGPQGRRVDGASAFLKNVAAAGDYDICPFCCVLIWLLKMLSPPSILISL